MPAERPDHERLGRLMLKIEKGHGMTAEDYQYLRFHLTRVMNACSNGPRD